MEAVLAPLDLEDTMSAWANKQYVDKYAWKDEEGNPTEVWPDTAYRVTRHVLGELGYTDKDIEFQKILKFIAKRQFVPGGRYLANSGRALHQTQNCCLYRCEDSREGWADLLRKSSMSLMTGAGIGVVYSDVRARGQIIRKTGGYATGPLSPMQMINEVARQVMSGGNRRSAIWAGLHWWHADVFDFINIKDWSQDIRDMKKKDFNNPAPMDMTNISVILDDDFFSAFEGAHPIDLLRYAPDGGSWQDWAQRVYYTTNASMVKTAEPGFSIDVGKNAGENLRNACCEITSSDDSDICNLGSINLARVETIEEFKELIRYSTLFLLAGTVYSHVPHEEVKKTREKNRRLGLGLMGIHEWLLKRGYPYEVVDEFRLWLEEYAKSTEVAAVWADEHGLSRPKKTRALAPNGTIGIVTETTQSIEPIFCVAEKRRFLSEGTTWKYQYVINPTAARLIEKNGVDPESIEDAYSLGYNYEKRIKFQADVQDYVDHGISSTMNLPYPIVDADEAKDFADILYKYLPRLRGVTVYPDGARSGQPLTAVPYEVAINQLGVTFEENEESCVGGSCGV